MDRKLPLLKRHKSYVLKRNQKLRNLEFRKRQTIPEHTEELFRLSTDGLDKHQKSEVKRLLSKYSDVFAQDDLDLGNFTELEYAFDTDTAKPVKQRMRRTPACFVDEEEAHPQKMLDAGVIQPSISEWASAPVLIRKRDGGVRWCIDYRALNSVTVKYAFPLPLIEECLDTLDGNICIQSLMPIVHIGR